MPKRVKEPVALGNEDGSITVLSPDDLYADDHPLVVRLHKEKKDHLLVDALDGVIETATAAPGEKRAK